MKPTQRQENSQKISKDRARQKRREVLVRRASIGMLIAASFAVGGGGWQLYRSGLLESAGQVVADNSLKLSARTGLRFEHLYVEGRVRTSKEMVLQTLNLSMGTPILSISPREVQSKLEEISTVRTASVDRILPNTLHIRLEERFPAIVWQSEGKRYVVDAEGAVMEDANAKDYPNLLIMSGEGALAHTKELLALLEQVGKSTNGQASQDNNIAMQVTTATWVGNRRWNIRLKNNVNIMLPEDNPQNAWKHLAQLQQERDVLEKPILAIDLRLEGKVFLRLLPEIVPQPPKKPSKNSVKET